MIGYIYSIINKTNGKRYVGQTMNIERRLSVHKRKLTNNIHHSQKLQNAWNKYGETNFIFEYESFQINSLEELSTLEKQYIKKYDSFENGYNMTEGGEGCPNIPKERQEALLISLCIIKNYENCGHAIEEYFGWHRNTLAPLGRAERYPEIWEKYNNLSEKVQKEIADKYYQEWKIKEIISKRLSPRGSIKSFFLTKEDHFFIYAAHELGYKAPVIARYFDVSDDVVKDRLRKKAKANFFDEYFSLEQDKKDKYYKEVKESDIYRFLPDKVSKEKEEQILYYLIKKEEKKNTNSYFEKKFGWSAGTCSQINSPKHFIKQKEIYKRLTEEEKEKILMQFVE